VALAADGRVFPALDEPTLHDLLTNLLGTATNGEAAEASA
jgi:hypothetical protein